MPKFDDRFTATVIADASVGYRHGPWNFALDDNNIFIKYPAKSKTALNLRGINPYPVCAVSHQCR